MVTVRLRLFQYFIYARYMREHCVIVATNGFFGGGVQNFFHLPLTWSVYVFPLENSQTLLCYMISPSSNTVPPPGAPLWQIWFVVIRYIQRTNDYTKLYHILLLLLLYNYYCLIIMRCPKLLFEEVFCHWFCLLLCVLFIVLRYLCLYMVLFL